MVLNSALDGIILRSSDPVNRLPQASNTVAKSHGPDQTSIPFLLSRTVGIIDDTAIEGSELIWLDHKNYLRIVKGPGPDFGNNVVVKARFGDSKSTVLPRLSSLVNSMHMLGGVEVSSDGCYLMWRRPTDYAAPDHIMTCDVAGNHLRDWGEMESNPYWVDQKHEWASFGFDNQSRVTSVTLHYLDQPSRHERFVVDSSVSIRSGDLWWVTISAKHELIVVTSGYRAGLEARFAVLKCSLKIGTVSKVVKTSVPIPYVTIESHELSPNGKYIIWLVRPFKSDLKEYKLHDELLSRRIPEETIRTAMLTDCATGLTSLVGHIVATPVHSPGDLPTDPGFLQPNRLCWMPDSRHVWFFDPNRMFIVDVLTKHKQPGK